MTFWPIFLTYAINKHSLFTSKIYILNAMMNRAFDASLERVCNFYGCSNVIAEEPSNGNFTISDVTLATCLFTFLFGLNFTCIYVFNPPNFDI